MIAKICASAIALSLTTLSWSASQLTLCDFESAESSKIIEKAKEITYGPDHATQKRNAGLCPAGMVLSMMEYTGMQSDLSAYDTMAIDIFNPGAPGKLKLVVVDAKGSEYNDKHNSEHDLKTGVNVVVIPFGKLWRGAQNDGLFLDKKNLKQIYIVLPKESGAGYYVDNWRLVKTK